MNCTKCGTAISAQDVFCGSCGAPVSASLPPPPAQASAPPPPAPPQAQPVYGGGPGYPAYPQAPMASSSNTLSTLGIVFGAIAFLFIPILFGPIGIILGAVAKSRGEAKATTALWVSILGLVLGMIIGALVWGSV